MVDFIYGIVYGEGVFVIVGIRRLLCVFDTWNIKLKPLITSLEIINTVKFFSNLTVRHMNIKSWFVQIEILTSGLFIFF